MKKFIKSISVICLALVMVVPMLLLSGCTKNYKINISIAAGANLGQVNAVQSNGRSIVGKNLVEEGTKFEYAVKANDYCEIESIVVDGKEIEITDNKLMYPCIEEVKSDHTIVVKFKGSVVNVEFYAKDGIYKTVPATVGNILNLNSGEYGPSGNNYWYQKQGMSKYYLVNDSEDANAPIPSGYASNQVLVRGPLQLYTDKYKSELSE